MRKICNLVVYAVCAGSLAACGQTGPLYLPPQPVGPHATTHTAPAATQIAPAASTARTPAASSLSAAAKATSPVPQAPQQTPPPLRKTR